jgi:hypothetical protein
LTALRIRIDHEVADRTTIHNQVAQCEQAVHFIRLHIAIAHIRCDIRFQFEPPGNSRP